MEYIKVVKDRDEKLKIMKECDCAFTISVIGRALFDELFEKIHNNAIFLGMYNEKSKVVGYSSFYANDEQTKTAFLTLFCIKPNMQHNGRGEILLKKSLEISSELGMKKTRLMVYKADVHAISFYKKCGFYTTGHETSDFIEMER